MKGLEEGNVDEEDLRVHGLSVGTRVVEGGKGDGGKVDDFSPEIGSRAGESGEASSERAQEDGVRESSSPTRQEILNIDGQADDLEDEDSEDYDDDDDDDDDEDEEQEDEDDAEEDDYGTQHHQDPEQNKENIDQIGKILRDPAG